MLDTLDRQILHELDTNARRSVSEIAKLTNIRRTTVQYRLQKLFDEGVITRTFADIDVAKAGFILNKIVFKFQGATQEDELRIFDFLKNHPRVGWVAFGDGSWDAMIVAYVRDMLQYHELVQDIMEEVGSYIHSKAFIAHPRYFVCSRKWLIGEGQSTISKIGGVPSDAGLDDVDRRILLMLTSDARTSIVDIASATGMSSSAILHRIRNLEDEGVILNYRISLDLELLGKQFCKCFVYMHPGSDPDRFVTHCLSHPNITAVTHSIGPWELELELEVDDVQAYYALMSNLKTRFAGVIRNYETVFLTREYGIDYASFL